MTPLSNGATARFHRATTAAASRREGRLAIPPAAGRRTILCQTESYLVRVLQDATRHDCTHIAWAFDLYPVFSLDHHAHFNESTTASAVTLLRSAAIERCS